MITIVLVDDESGQLEIMKTIILELCPNSDVLCFDNSLNALDYISLHPVDAVITDIKMPGLDGLELSKEISLLNQDIIVAIISAYNDFEYAQKAIRYNVTGYLIKPVSHSKITELFDKIYKQLSEKEARRQHMELLNSQLESYKPAYIDRQLNAWLRGTASAAELSSIQSAFKYNGYGILVATRLHRPSEDSVSGCSLSDLIAFTKVTIHQLFSPDQTVLTVVYNEEKLILVSVIVGEGDLPADLVSDNFHALFRTVREEYGIRLVSGASEIVPAVTHDVSLYVRQALTALDCTFINTASGYIAHRDLKDMAPLAGASLHAFQNRLLDKFYLYDGNGVRDILHSFLADYADHGYLLPSNVLRQYFINILFLANQHVQCQQKDHTIEEINSCPSIAILTAIIGNRLTDLIAMQQKKAGEATQQMIDSMKRYIDSHFAENISLESIADQMHFNPNYIGSLFKQQFGIGFKDYVTGCRIDKAKQLLTGTNLKIYEIAEKTGYGDVAYFIRIFKKETGVSPNKFRMEHFNKELG